MCTHKRVGLAKEGRAEGRERIRGGKRGGEFARDEAKGRKVSCCN